MRVSIIEYANTIPFLFGLKRNTFISKNSAFFFHYPSQGVKGLIENNVDISIVPAAAIAQIANAEIISDFCIAAHGRVDSVLLKSKVPIQNIRSILLDYQSQTSNALCKILCNEFWNISPTFVTSNKDGYDAFVIIGDRAFLEYSEFSYTYDLAEAWLHAFNLPFVFACWVANKPISTYYLEQFNAALEYGVLHLQESIDEKKCEYAFDLQNYISSKVQYKMNSEHKMALDLFISKAKQYVK